MYKTTARNSQRLGTRHAPRLTEKPKPSAAGKITGRRPAPKRSIRRMK